MKEISEVFVDADISTGRSYNTNGRRASEKITVKLTDAKKHVIIDKKLCGLFNFTIEIMRVDTEVRSNVICKENLCMIERLDITAECKPCRVCVDVEFLSVSHYHYINI